MQVLLSLVVYLFSIIFCFYVLGYKYQNQHSGTANLFASFLFAQSLYIIPPAIDQMLGLENYFFIVELITYTSICSIFFLFGALIALNKKKFNTPSETNVIQINLQTRQRIFYLIFFIGFSCSVYYLVLLYDLFSTNLIAFFGSVGLVEYANEGNFRQMQVRLLAIIAGAGITMIYFRKENRTLFLLFMFIFLILCLSLLVRGNRNFLLFALAPVLIYYLNMYRLLTFKNTLILFIGFIGFAQLIDIIRAVGFYSISEIPVEVFQKGLSTGEFGSTIRSFDYYMQEEFIPELLLGKSYLIDPILNMATTLGFPFEVLSYKLAVAMSGDQLIGFGFSPQLESLINFGIFGPMVYLVFGYVLAKIDNLKNKSVYVSILCFYLYAIIINMQRIDFAVVIKLSAIPIFIISITFFLSKLRLGKS